MRGQGAGFTRIELLVVIIISIVVIGMLVAAIWKVRESDRRLQCSNNLKQIGEAMQRYHNKFGYLPPGGPHYPDDSDHSPRDRPELWTWAYQILPYADEKDLFTSRDFERINRTPLKIYYCPSRRSVDWSPEARIDYAGNAGTRAEDGLDGLIVRTGRGRVSLIADIPDGMAQTILVAEKQLNSDQFGKSLDDNECYATSGWNGSFGTYRLGLEPPAADFRSPSTEPSQRFGSAHAFGIHALFADGSVRGIRYTVEPSIFRRACVRDDHFSFNLDEP
jgi:prepilin-type processing-associated H-X9-DG protein